MNSNNYNKIAIIGANGFLGRKLLYLFSPESVIAVDIENTGIKSDYSFELLDISKKDQIRSFLSKNKPHLVYLTAAMTNVDACEDIPEKAMQINGISVGWIAESIRSYGGKLIHVSTDFIFDGKSGNYQEDAQSNPLSVYGKSKLLGEKLILKSGVISLICRTSVIFGWPEKDQNSNFFSWAYNSLKQIKKLSIIDGQITTPTLCDDLAKFLFNMKDFTLSEIYHTTGNEAISKFNFVSKIAQRFGFDLDLVEKISEFPQKAKRPENSSLNSSKIQKIPQYCFHNIEESLDFLFRYKN